MATSFSDDAVTIRQLRGNPRRRRKEAVLRFILAAAAVFSILISVSIVVAIIGRAMGFLSDVDLSALCSTAAGGPVRGSSMCRRSLIGSFVVTAIAMVVAIPLGLGAAIYLSEYASPRVRRRLKPILETLAGIPSVVIGFFALTVLNPSIVQASSARPAPSRWLAAGIGVGILTIPSDRVGRRGRDVRRPRGAARGGLRDRRRSDAP